MSGFVLHPDALADLNEIWDFIAAANAGAADRVLEEIHEAIQALARFPQLGHSRSDLTSRPLRFHPVRNYLVAYAPDENPPVVAGGTSWRAQSTSDCCVPAHAKVSQEAGWGGSGSMET